MSRLYADGITEFVCQKPLEPVRTLDAIHLASALFLRESFPDLLILSTDERVRHNALPLGFDVLPH
ncbi:MAG: hypothetical protein HY268_02755 [Deltaproteobacteria bacterium]|nr:hypothetical protein [Deltaproteobacteria bacterium]